MDISENEIEDEVVKKMKVAGLYVCIFTLVADY